MVIKEIIKKQFPVIYWKLAFIRNFHYYYWKPKKVDSIDQIIELYCENVKNIKFVQIGANDGIMQDKIHNFIIQYKWEGILVEPVKYLFEKLKVNYNNIPKLQFENSAISDKSNIKDFYRLKKSQDFTLPFWAEGLGSFSLETLKNNCANINDFREELIIKEKFQCITFGQLAEKYNLKEIDFLQTDTEGHDYEIIKTIDLEKFKINAVLFEHCHLSEKDYKFLWMKLKQNFVLMSEDGDTIALRKKLYRLLKNKIRFRKYYLSK